MVLLPPDAEIVHTHLCELSADQLRGLLNGELHRVYLHHLDQSLYLRMKPETYRYSAAWLERATEEMVKRKASASKKEPTQKKRVKEKTVKKRKTK